MAANPTHYSGVKAFGAGSTSTLFQHLSTLTSPSSHSLGAVGWLQEGFGAKLYYHPYTMIGGNEVKYGVISSQHLEEDLAQWTTLYTSGRLHKPTLIVEQDDHFAMLQLKNLECESPSPNIGCCLFLLLTEVFSFDSDRCREHSVTSPPKQVFFFGSF